MENENAGTCEIGDLAVIGDCRSAALVSHRGSMDWLCWPRFDSPALFAALLDRERGGHWSITPADIEEVGREYVSDTGVLQTEFRCRNGRAVLTDLFPVADETYKRAHVAPDHELLRRLECVEGEVEAVIDFAPRWAYGRSSIELREVNKLGIVFTAGRGQCWLRSEVPLKAAGGAARAKTTLRAGEGVGFSLTYSEEAPAVLPPLGARVHEAISRSVAWWQGWTRRSQYSGPYHAAVTRSALALKLMTYAPSGAIVAAPTTSLPERLGGDLNWDYRYCWLRDASLTVRAFLELGYRAEAEAFVEWLLHATRLTQPKLRVMYTVFGQPCPRERTLDYLSGYAGSRPVRVGNGAREQLQLDVYGEVMDAAAQYAFHGGQFDRTTQRVLTGFGNYVCEHWREPDEGIWEPRGGPVQHTHSRLLCWVALDRLVRFAEQGIVQRAPADKFRRERAAIAQDIREHAWNAELESYTATLGGRDMDATLLLIPWYGFEAADSARMRATYRQVVKTLRKGDVLYRYRGAEREGAFGVCSFWEVEYLALRGDVVEARALFERLLRFGNDVGLFAEEIEPGSGAALGNFPQAFTHIGLISAALSLQQKGQGAEPLPHRAPAAE